MLTGIAALGIIAAHWISVLAVIASRGSATAGILVFALVPGAAFVTAVGMLVLMGRLTDATQRSAASALATFASALLLYLVLYEQNGQLTEDRRVYLYETTMEAVYESAFNDDAPSALDRIPEVLSVSVLGILVVALVLRSLGAAFLDRQERRDEIAREQHRTRGRGATIGTGALRVVVTYSELVWLVLSVLAAVAVGNALRNWWSSRSAVHAVSDAWARLDWPQVAPAIGAVGGVVGTLVEFAVAGVLVPAGWLAFGTVLYGTRRGATAALASRAAEVTASLGSRVAVPRAADALTDVARLQRSWSSLVRPTSRWGPLGGAAGLVLARGWLPIGVFCILFTILAQADYLVWWLADLLLPTVAANDWRAIYPLVAAVGTVLVQVLTLALVAAGTELTMRRLGLPSILRLPHKSKDQ
ncbi:hypothetical protein GCM10025875_35430 [Litorihabitans aurantiacus]|uniref:Uncharacterized protein n=1 Tax=Litorihabitans aurantiacus TaxID=1930061 RepID=A0AA37UMT3_9MICO|nr:hypothetical protein GCM10025875_00450 [Litorihabitans aurantiacus]GMA33551.1 hypothetical protein GCM10025875_35430 [Litorihabitans aurantiacus]